MQVRGVPDADRAIAPDGTQLPWALYSWEQYKKLPEETGPFGKPRRRGLSRSKTATPARREDPNLEGFEQAFANDQRRKKQEDDERRMSLAQHQRSSISTQDQPSTTTTTSTLTTLHAVTDGLSSSTTLSGSLAPRRDPTEVILYGFKPSQQHTAIDQYERIGGARICEDYARDEPVETQKYPSLSSKQARRPLTREEKIKANNYAGGECWIKVTYESSEAAHRAVGASPHRVNAHWVYAELYHGVGPKEDREYPVLYTESDPYGQQPPKYPLQTSRLLSSSMSAPSLTVGESASGPLSRTPGSFEGSTELPPSSTYYGPDRSPPLSPSSTASSATATGIAPGNTYSNEVPFLRSRSLNPATPTTTSSAPPPTTTNSSEFCTRIPTARRAILRPAEEALLPSRTTSQWLASFLPPGLLTGQMISEVPRTADGTFDYTGASLYWKIWYWIGRVFYFDTLGLHDD